jgi:tRNA/tmRNA/rRNA uracil-C5-methylase (TrmA/RlmC/RlmD family)
LGVDLSVSPLSAEDASEEPEYARQLLQALRAPKNPKISHVGLLEKILHSLPTQDEEANLLLREIDAVLAKANQPTQPWSGDEFILTTTTTTTTTVVTVSTAGKKRKRERL